MKRLALLVAATTSFVVAGYAIAQVWPNQLNGPATVNVTAQRLALTPIGPTSASSPTPPPTTTTPPPAGSDAIASWVDAEAGAARQPTIIIDAGIYPNAQGVQFLVRGAVDARCSCRPGGFDATGPQEGSKYHVYPDIALAQSDVIEARWIDRSGVARSDQHIVGGSSVAPTPTPTPAPSPTVPPNTAPPGVVAGEFGPSGAWPAGFPAYASPASIVTNGTNAGLRAAINSLATSGGVIEHPADVSGLGDVGLSRPSGTSAPIVIRPPLGRRADFTLRDLVALRSSGLLLAGWNQPSEVQVWGVSNSGIAWMESQQTGQFRVIAEGTTPTVGLWYEGVYRTYSSHPSDRSAAYATSPGTNVTMDAVGLWLAGKQNPPGQDGHTDAIQLVPAGGGKAQIYVRNSVIWAGSNSALQGHPSNPFHVDNSMIFSPGNTNNLFPGTVPNLNGYMAIIGQATVKNSILVGATHPDYPVTVQNSTIYDATSGIVDQGGNTFEASAANIAVPHAPTHTELDAIWHP